MIMTTKGQGWHGHSKGHSQAAKGKSASDSSASSGSQGQGWHKDSEGHSQAAKGKSVKSDEGFLDKITP
jgi:hypothetical protein